MDELSIDPLQMDRVDAEQCVLGAVMLSRAALDDVQDVLTSADFYAPKHEVVFEAVRRLAGRGEPVDVITVTGELQASGDLDLAGGAWYLHELASAPPTAANAGYYADMVHESAVRRRVSQAGHRIAQWGPDLPLPELADKARGEVDEALGMQKQKVRFLRDSLRDVIDRADQGVVRYASPWPSLDAAIGGFMPGALYVIGARPAQGKSVVAGQCAMALGRRGLVAFSSLEMAEEEITNRLVSASVGIGVDRLNAGKLSPRDWEKFAEHKSRLDEMGIAIDDRAGVGPDEIRQFARSVSRHGQLAGIIVDYLQLMTSASRSDRWVQVSEFSRRLKVLAKDLRVPVIALSQLNRQSENRADSRPKLSDLRESGSIEQDADVVILLSREKAIAGHKLNLDVAKNRHGEESIVSLHWQGALSRAVEWDDAVQ